LNNTQEMERGTNALVRQDFGGSQYSAVTEQSSQSMSARETALIQARFIMAMQRPRKLEDVRARLKKSCEIFEFADEAWYSRPAGKEFDEATGQWVEKQAEGFSIRFAEEAGRMMGNMLSDSQIVAETPDERVVHVWSMDLETNFTRGVSVSVPKVIERKTPKKGQFVLAERENSRGDKVYIVAANRNELHTTQNNLVAKAERQCILKMVPAWILRDCKETIQATLAAEVKKNPDAAKRKLRDAFAGLNIMPSDLQLYIGHSLDRLGEKEIADLRNVYRAINQGEITWEEILALKQPEGSQEMQDEVKARLIAEAEAKKAAQQQGQQQTSTDGNPASASGSGDQATQQGMPGETSSAPTTPTETKPATSRPTFGRRQS
jgi:hypothetical protein